MNEIDLIEKLINESSGKEERMRILNAFRLGSMWRDSHPTLSCVKRIFDTEDALKPHFAEMAKIGRPMTQNLYCQTIIVSLC